MWDQSSGSQFGQIIQSLMQQNPQVAQRLMQLMSQQRTAGIGSLQPRQGGGPMPMGPAPGNNNSAMTPEYGGFLGQAPQWHMMPAQGSAPYSPPPYASPMPGWATPGRGGAATGIPGVGGGSTGMNPGMGGQRQNTGNSGSSPLGPPPVAGYGGNQGTGPTLPYAQRFNTNPGPSYPAIPMPTVTGGRSQTPYTPPPFVSPMPEWQTPQRPAPFSAPASQPKTYGASQPAGPSLAQNGTSGLDWYAMQAGN
jgi:hypothetical protein